MHSALFWRAWGRAALGVAVMSWDGAGMQTVFALGGFRGGNACPVAVAGGGSGLRVGLSSAGQRAEPARSVPSCPAAGCGPWLGF